MTRIEVEDWICKTLCNGTGCPVVNVMARYQETVDRDEELTIKKLRKLLKASGLDIRNYYYNSSVNGYVLAYLKGKIVIGDCNKTGSMSEGHRLNCGSVFAIAEQGSLEAPLELHYSSARQIIYTQWLLSNRLRRE